MFADCMLNSRVLVLQIHNILVLKILLKRALFNHLCMLFSETFYSILGH